jgi:thiosulfate dehydrogenase
MKFIAGVVIGIIIVPLFAFLYVYFGYAPVATSAPPFPFEKKIASMALNARIHKSPLPQSPIQPTEDNLMAGAHVYREQCAVCHGLPNQPKTPAAQGMYPPPPQLFHGKGVADDPPGETYWKVTNGIRLTGMPAFSTLSDTERWQISELLANADKASAAVKTYLAQPSAVK